MNLNQTTAKTSGFCLGPGARATATECAPTSPNSQTQDYLEDLSGVLDMAFSKLQDTFVRINPILRSEVPTDNSVDRPPRCPETQLNGELHKLLDKANAIKSFLDYNFPRISV